MFNFSLRTFRRDHHFPFVNPEQKRAPTPGEEGQAAAGGRTGGCGARGRRRVARSSFYIKTHTGSLHKHLHQVHLLTLSRSKPLAGQLVPAGPPHPKRRVDGGAEHVGVNGPRALEEAVLL